MVAVQGLLVYIVRSYNNGLCKFSCVKLCVHICVCIPQCWMYTIAVSPSCRKIFWELRLLGCETVECLRRIWVDGMIFSVNIFRAFALYESFLLIMKVMLSGADPGGGVKWVASHPPKHINLDFPLHILFLATWQVMCVWGLFVSELAN